MIMEPNYNIVVIGMGNIGKYLMPGYRCLLGDKAGSNVFGVRRNPDKVAELQKQVPFPVSAGNTVRLLREKRPDIIIVSTPPAVIPLVAQEDLKPYFEEARRKGWNLPDIYTFGPTPEPRMYLDLLGEDVLAAKFLPSMIKEKQESRCISWAQVSSPLQVPSPGNGKPGPLSFPTCSAGVSLWTRTRVYMVFPAR